MPRICWDCRTCNLSPGAHAILRTRQPSCLPCEGRHRCEKVDEQSGQGWHLWGIIQEASAECAVQVTSASVLNKVIFKDKADAAVTRKLTSLFPGLGYAAGYKVSRGFAMMDGTQQHFTERSQRSCKESINMAGNLSSVTTWRFITATSSIGPSAKVQGRP